MTQLGYYGRHRTTVRSPRSGIAYRGFVVVEALVAILIFSLGVLGLVALQTRAVTASADAQYRVQAALLANELIGRMWASDRTPTTLQAQFDSTQNGSAFAAWAWQGYNSSANAQQTTAGAATGSVLATLPMAGGVLMPVVSVTPVTTGTITNSLVTVKLQWQTPNDLKAAVVHSYVTTAQIGG